MLHGNGFTLAIELNSSRRDINEYQSSRNSGMWIARYHECDGGGYGKHTASDKNRHGRKNSAILSTRPSDKSCPNNCDRYSTDYQDKPTPNVIQQGAVSWMQKFLKRKTGKVDPACDKDYTQCRRCHLQSGPNFRI